MALPTLLQQASRLIASANVLTGVQRGTLHPRGLLGAEALRASASLARDPCNRRLAAVGQQRRLWLPACTSSAAPDRARRRLLFSAFSSSSSSFSHCPSLAAFAGQQPASCLPSSDWHRRQYSSGRPEVLANGDIPFPKVRVVDDAGLVGDFLLGEALALAKQRHTDLVVLSGVVEPPLCRLVGVEQYLEELESEQAQKAQRARERKLREFSFDPGLKVKGMRFTALVDEHDFERKVNQVRKFLEKGHRVEARILQSRSPAEDVIDLALRIIAEVRDLAKPEYLEESIREFRAAFVAPKSLKKANKAPPDELRLRLWPCSPEQAAAFTLPAHILGPRRRRGPRIAGIDDENEDPDAWKYNRKPRDRNAGGFKRVPLMEHTASQARGGRDDDDEGM